MANSYKSSIGISITLDPQNKVKSDLEQLLNKLSQTNKLNISIDSQINQQIKEVSNNLNNIYSQTNKPMSLSSLTKSAEESAKVFETLGEQIGKIREKSELKTKQMDRSQELSQAKAINKALEEGYTIEQKQAEAYKQIAVMKANGIISSSDIAKLEQMVKDANSLKSINSALNSVMSTSMMKESSIVGITKQLTEAQNKLEKMKQTFGSKLPSGFVESTESEINKLKNDLTKVDGMNFNGIKNSLNQLNNDMKLVSEQAKSSEGFFSKLGNTLKNVGIYIDITDIIRGVSNGIKEAVDVTIKMDTALGNLNKVVSMSSSQLLQMRDSAVEMGKELGRSSIEVANAQAEFGRLYKTQDEINNMTKVSVMGANVMDGATADQVAKGLTTIITSMKMEAKDSMGILDSMNEIQNNYRVGANDLMNALAEVGSTAYTSGTNLKQVEGYITSIAVATGKSGDEIGNSLKSMMSRVYKLGSEGLESEGKPEQMLKSMGVAVRDSAGNFRDFSAILGDLDVKWQKMSNTEKIATAQVVAGVHRYNDFMSLMNNYSMAVDSTNTALNSQGSALKENEIHMQTAEAKLGTLKATTEAFYMKLINSDAIKSGIDGLTKLIETFGNLPTIIGLTTSAIIAFGGKALVTAITNVGGYITSLISLASTEGVVATATTELSLAMSTNPFGLIAIAIAGLTVGLVALNHSFEESTNYIGKMNEATKGLQELKSTENLVKQYNDLNATINSTSSTVEQVTSAKEKLLGVQKQLASQNPELVDGYTKEGDALVRNIKLLEDKITKDKKALGAEAESNYGNLINQINGKQMNKFYDTSSDSIWWLPNTWKSDIETYNNLIKESENSEKGLSESRKDKLTELSTKFGDLNKAIVTIKDNGKDISGKQMFDFSTGNLVDAEKYLKDIESQSTQASNKTQLVSQAMKELNSSTGVSSTTIEKLNQLYPDMGVNASNAKEKIQSLNSELNNIGANGVEDQAKSVEEATKSYNDATQSIAKAQGYIDKLNKANAVTPALAKQIAKAYGDVGTSINSVGDTVDFLKGKILEEQEAQSSAIEIMKGDDESFYSEKIKNNQTYQDQVNSFLNAFVDDSQGAYDVDLSHFSTLNQMKAGVQDTLKSAVDSFMSQFVDINSSGYKVDYNNFTSLISAKKEMLKAFLGSMSDVLWDMSSNSFTESAYGGVDLSGGQSDETYKRYEAKVKGVQEEQSKIQGMLAKADGIYSGGGLNFQGFSGGGTGGTSDFSGTGGGSGGSKGKEAKDYTDDIAKMTSDIKIDRYYELNNALSDVNNTLTDNKTIRDGLIEGSKEYQDSQLKDIEAYKQKQVALQNLNNEQKKEQEEIRNKLKQYDFEFDANGKLINSQKKLAELQTNINNMGGSSEADKNKKQEYINWLKEVNDDIKRYGDLSDDIIPKTANEWSTVTNEIKKTTEEMKKANEEILQNYYDKLAGDILTDMKKELTTATEEADQAEERAKKAIEDEKAEKTKYWEDRIQALQDELDALNNTEADEKTKLKKLQEERNLWLKDNSTESTKKVRDLDVLIAETSKSIQKSELQKQIDDLNSQKEEDLKSYDERLKEKEDFYAEQKKEQDKANEDSLLEEKAYAKAKELIQSNNQVEILKIIKSHADEYKNAGSLLSQNFNDGYLEEYNKFMNSYGNLSNSSNILSANGSSNVIIAENTGGIPPADTEVQKANASKSSSKEVMVGDFIKISNSNGDLIDNVQNGTAMSSGGSLNSYNDEKLKTVGYDNGYFKLAEENGSIIGWARRDDIARFKTGGRLGDLGEDGKFVLADSYETILNADDTKQMDENTMMINGIYDFVKTSSGLFSQLNNSYINPNNYYMPSLIGSDLNGIASNITNNNNNTNTKQGDISITQTFNLDARSDSRVKTIASDTNTLLKKELRSLGILTNK